MTDTTPSLSPILSSIRERLFGAVKTDKKATSPSLSNGESTATQDTHNVTDVNNVWRMRWDAAPDKWKHFVVTQEKQYGLSEEEENRIVERNRNYVETADLTGRARFGTTAIILTVGSISKLLLRSINSLHTYDLNVLYDAINKRPKNMGLLTISNHQSVMDDPFLLGAILPPSILMNAKKMRWGLCSMDICFQDAWTSRTLRLGKALPIQRRGGMSQRFLRNAAEKLAVSDWVHVFPEGRVRQKGMGYFKRGVGKMLAMSYESTNGMLPLLLPMYHEGIEKVMPQKADSNDLESHVPKGGKHVFLVMGDAVDVSHIFNRLMPECQASGGTSVDAPACLRLYEEVADFLAVIMRLLRADARQKVKEDHNVDLGHPYEYS